MTTTTDSVKNAGLKREPGKPADQNTALHQCYRQIGISAVAAAARYRGDSKNPAYAPAQPGRYDDDAAFE
jgi:hypothetical protein